VTIEGQGGLLMDAAGKSERAFSPAAFDSSKPLRVTVTPAVAGTAVVVRLLPKASGTDKPVTAKTTGGKARLDYTFDGPPGYSSKNAKVIVSVAGTALAGATVRWAIVSGPQSGMGGDIGAQGFEYPVAAVPAGYTLEATVRDNAGNPVADGADVQFTFLRNTTHDLAYTGQPTDAQGKTTLAAPARMDISSLAGKLAAEVLKHPMIGTPNLPWFRKFFGRLMGGVIQRHELTRILMEMAAGEGAAEIEPGLRNALVQLLKENGVPDAGAALAAIRDAAQKLEHDKPAQAAHERQTEAILQAARSAFVGKINEWFDQTSDRVTQRFALRARMVTVFSALLVAVSTQTDSLDLIKRLSVDDKLRESLVGEAQAEQKRIDGFTPAQNAERTSAKAQEDEIQRNLAKMREPQLSVLPDHFLWEKVPQATLPDNPAWVANHANTLTLVTGTAQYTVTPDWKGKPLDSIRTALEGSGALAKVELADGAVPKLVITPRHKLPLELRFKPDDATTNILDSWTVGVWPGLPDSSVLVGVAVTWMLLSLGAPFWYDALKDLLKLRPALAGKEEAERKERQLDQTAVAAKKKKG
jgi:hypothetical protein